MTTVARAHFPALSRGNQIRLERARLKRMLKAGTLSFQEALLEDAFQGMLLYDLLLALPPDRRRRAGLTETRGRKVTILATYLFAHLQRSPLTRVGDITPREQRILVWAYRTR